MGSEQERAVIAWNLMGATIDWAALDAITEYLEIKDVDTLIDNLLVLKDFQDKQRASQ